MDDLISREKALEALEETKYAIDACIKKVKKIPSETKYGSWKTIGKTPSGSIILECTSCGVQKKGRPKSAYCPDCGAKMLPNKDYIPGQGSFEI